jgi:hypothetical protein
MTLSTLIADGAISPAVHRIDKLLKSFSEEASSEAYSTARRSADAAARLGFKSSANLRYAAFLEDFRVPEDLAEHYQENYPSCFFLTWRGFHALRRTLDLWCELPEHYAGAVPDAQLPWMDLFELYEGDRPGLEDDAALLQIPPEQLRRVRAHSTYNYSILGEYQHVFCSSFFVLAPKEAFRTAAGKMDWIARYRSAQEKVSTDATTPPEDPLIIRFCQGGALVVAAWGDEAVELNKITQALKL